jgi:hypothetical protein
VILQITNTKTIKNRKQSFALEQINRIMEEQSFLSSVAEAGSQEG